MNQMTSSNQQGENQPPQQQKDQHIAHWISIGLLAVILLATVMFIGIFLLTNYMESGMFGQKSSVTQETPVVQTTPAVSATPTATPVPTPKPTVGGNSYYFNGDEIYFVNAFSNSGIYVRTEATKQSAKLMYIAEGDTNVRLRYLDETVSYDPVDNKHYVWYMVETPNGSVGFVRSDVVRQW